MPLVTKEKVDELMKNPGTVRGAGIKSYAQFILEKEGKEQLKRLEKEMEKAGYPIKYLEVGTMEVYPFGIEALTLILIKKLFGYGEEEFQKMGEFEMKVSLLIKLFMKYFVSLDRVAQEFPKMCRKHFSVGNFKIKELNKEKGEIVIRIEDFYFHPLHCPVLLGVFSEALRMITKKETQGKETKCIYKGDDAHEFYLSWK